MPNLLRSPDRPEVRVVMAVELPQTRKIKVFAAIPAACVSRISVKFIGFNTSGYSAAKVALRFLAAAVQ